MNANFREAEFRLAESWVASEVASFRALIADFTAQGRRPAAARSSFNREFAWTTGLANGVKFATCGPLAGGRITI
jgi:hypothetical protein